MGSDTWIDNPASMRAHRALGFDEVDRCINYRKSIAPAAEAVDVRFELVILNIPLRSEEHAH